MANTIATLISNYIKVTVFSLMLGMGLNLAFEQITYLWRQPKMLIRSFLAAFVLVPIAAIIVVAVLKPPAAVSLGIILMGCAPGATLVYRKISKMGWDATFAASFQETVSIVAVVLTPLLVTILSRIYHRDASVAPQEIFKQLLMVQLIPLVIGLAIRKGIPELADDIAKPITEIANIMFLVLTILILVRSLGVVLSLGIVSISAIALVAAASLLIGYILGDSTPETQTALAISNASRNSSLALLIAAFNFNAEEIKPAIISYVLISGIIAFVYNQQMKRRIAQAKISQAN
ncbi:bile acid:sodium symporter [Chlorogloeopsis sp. ULAP01]|uniref:bile acid:sodium symporter family protein n=1 Tax=Chlorogloeopsis sp. ULAP01 TaxID=3056483 RepID=UPI0025AAB470|nr:bile acid:sodium symporter [Chlorogloeopsis sp. ULAP01]MDM9383877.1 bile acid:sodium symporter [Chlorogloeopsis sp. ULAP01]